MSSGPVRTGPSCSGPTRGSGTRRSSSCSSKPAGSTRSACATSKVRAAIDAIPEDTWQMIPYTDGGEAQIAATTCANGG